jgi:ATP-GRASP peptide maturase of grasp-with-spasm system
MIVIISRENDISTCDVMDWLLHAKRTVIRINAEDTLTDLNINMDNSGKLQCIASFGNKKIDFSQVDCFWFRKGFLSYNLNITHSIRENVFKEISDHLKEEINTIVGLLIYLFEKTHSLGKYHQGNANKLISLAKACDVGLKIPETIVSCKKQDLTQFVEKHKNCISKSIQDILFFDDDDAKYYMNTAIAVKEDIDEMNSSFFPSQLQCNIPKRYELRVFYLAGNFYAMAIFSQQDPKTQLDFRNYNHQKPNRNVPYVLPKDIQHKLTRFMHEMNLDTGSIDMILIPEFEYVFLEVNPVGQYDMVSSPCNYYLHEKIAKYLQNENK